MKKFTLIALILSTGYAVNAQIGHIDVNPDKKLSGQYDTVKIHLAYPIGTTSSGPITYTDSAMMIWFHPNPEVGIQVKGTNLELMRLASATFPMTPAALDSGTEISETAGTWLKPNNVRINLNNIGNWAGGNGINKYLGVRFKRNSQWHYGWVKLSIDAAPTYVTIHEYAYEKQPLTAITAGAKTSPAGIGARLPLSSDISLQGKTLVISNLLTETAVSIADMSGRILSAESTGAGKYTKDMSLYPSGIYIINLESASASAAFKVYVR